MNNIFNGSQVQAVPDLQGQGRRLVQAAGSRAIALSEYENGAVRLELDSPPIRKLILSGGGAKGFAYAGALTALEQTAVLPGIESVHGSSAGAIMAALIASGMSATAFDELSDDTDLLALLDSEDPDTGWLQRSLARLGDAAGRALPGTVGSYTRMLLNTLPRLNSEALPLQTLIRHRARAAVLNLTEGASAAQVIVIRERLLAGAAVTFSDLDVLNRHIPQIKQLYITGTAMFSGVPQLVVFSATLTPDLDIAMAAHVSAALPVVFRQPQQQGLDFQAFDELTFFQDGGVLLNTPVPQLADPGQVTDLLSGADMLILQLDDSQQTEPGGRLKSFLFDWLAGAPVSANRALQNMELRRFTAQTVIVPLRTSMGDFSGIVNGNLNFAMTPDIRNHLQEQLEQAVRAHLEERAARREVYDFASLADALQSLDDEMLESVRLSAAHSRFDEATRWRQEALHTLNDLDQAVMRLDPQAPVMLEGEVQQCLERLDGLASADAFTGYLVRELNRHDRPGCRRLLESMRHQGTASPLLQAALLEMRRREIRVIAANIRKAVVFPSLHLAWQTPANQTLLLRVDQMLLQAVDARQVNQALDELVAGYQSLDWLPGNLWKSRTLELASAWRINAPDA